MRCGAIIFWFVVSYVSASAQFAGTADFSTLKILSEGNDGEVQGFSVSRDQKYIALANQGKVIKLFEGKTGKFYKRFTGYHNQVLEIILLPGGEQLLSVGNEATSDVSSIATIDLKTGAVIKSFTLPNKIRCITVNKDGTEAVMGDNKGVITFINLKDMAVLNTLVTGTPQVSSIAFNPDFTKVAAGTGVAIGYMIKKYPVFMLDAKTRSIARSFDGLPGATTSLKFSNDGKKLFSGHKANKRSIRVWDVEAGTSSELKATQSLISFSGYNGLEINGDNSVLIATTDDQSIEIYDLLSGAQISKKGRGKVKLLRTLEHVPKLVYSINDGKNFIIGGFNKNLLYIFNAEKKAMTGYFHSFNDEWAIVALDGRMDGSEGAIKNLAWKDGENEVPLDNTFEKNFTPRLLSLLIGGTVTPDFDVRKATAGLPQLELVMLDTRSIPSGKASPAISTAQKNIQVRLKVVKNAGEVAEISLHQNSKLVDSQKGSGKSEYVFDVTLGDAFGSDNYFFVTALSKSGIETEKKTFVVNYMGKSAAPAKLFLFTVGINQYKNPKYNLNFAQADANELENAFAGGSASLFSQVIKINLRDAKATREEILKGFATVKTQAKEQDILIFYYAGHGVMSDASSGEPDFFLVPNDITQLYGRDDLLRSKGISATELKELSKNINAQKQVFILDACQSAGALETVASRGAVEEKALAQLARSTGTFWITATGTQQFATEFKDLGHGVFTYSILEGLSGKADNGDKRITIKELSSYVENRVPELSEKYKGTAQFPSGYSFGNDFPIAILK